MSNEITLNILRRVPFAEGASFGETGPYERLVGTIDFAVDPADTRLRRIVDLDLAPRNRRGWVEFSADLDIIKPVNLKRGNRRLLYDVNNRGNRTALRSFNNAVASQDPLTREHAGNGYLMRRGYTIVWSGWQGDLVSGDGLVAYLPEATRNGEKLRGKVRQEFILETPNVLHQPVSGAANIECYPVTDADTATLTLREHEMDPRVELPRTAWQFGRAESDPRTGSLDVTPSQTDLYVREGFRPGWIYELIYETEGSRVMGLGLAGITELVSYLRHGTKDDSGIPNPLAGGIDKAYAFGASLSARVIREFVYEGFNEDASGKPVFDAVYPHLSGGGRVAMNQRFAQVGRFPRQHEEHQWPSERYPFAYGATPDAFTESLDSVLKRPGSDPLVVHTHSSSEYWQRHASLGQVDLRDGEDLQEPPSVAMYFLAGVPHGVMPAGPAPYGQVSGNSLPAGPALRACLEVMDAWASNGTPPPAARLPRVGEHTLVPPSQSLASFPKLRNVRLPASPSRLPFYDYGNDFDRRGMMTKPLPDETGHEYTVLIPQVDSDGNELGGLRLPDVEVPLGTYTGWRIRTGGGAGDLQSLNGSFIPFARTRAERVAAEDPRPSIEERYGSHEGYVQAITASAQRLASQRLLLAEDVERYVAAARARNPLDPSVNLGPLLAE